MPSTAKQKRHRILLVDDDPALLAVYRELLAQLPSAPEVITANSGPRAITLLETEEFRLFICDLKMPRMDGLQVLSIVRRKFPELRTVAITAVLDEQVRSRVYALGVDLFWNKPGTEQETRMFLECLESLLGQDGDSGFRGVQNKSLVDIVQLECLSQSSSVLRITNAPLVARIWIQDGEVIDAEADELRGEAAFHKVLSWKAGSFEMLPSESSRPRTIFKSYNGLLLESAQALDESQHQTDTATGRKPSSEMLNKLTLIEGIEFVIAMGPGQSGEQLGHGLDSPERVAAWAKKALGEFRALGEELCAGDLEQVLGLGGQHHVVLARQGETDVCAGWVPTVAPQDISERMRKVLALWGS